MKLFLIALILFVNVSNAADKGTAYKIVCKPMTDQKHVYDCVRMVANYSHFDDSGLLICGSMHLDESKTNCLDTLGDKTYKDYEIAECQGMATEEKKVECLYDLGIYNP
jgi:hypothetical protein